jgi:transcriptional regulator with XRE-family HTH domain
LLKARKASQTELAEAIGTSQQVVSRWLETNTPPKSVYLLRLSRYLDVPVDYLIDDDQVEPPRGRSDLSEDERVALAVVRGLRDLGVSPEEILKRLLQQAPPVIRWGKGKGKGQGQAQEEAGGVSARAGRPEEAGLEPVRNSKP